MKTINWLVLVTSVLIPHGASAQTTDADYCKALAQKYEQCKAGNTASGIPVLEQKLRDARIDLPSRG